MFNRYKGLVLVCIILLASCKQVPPGRAFYYWKTRFSLSKSETDLLKNVRVQKLYIRFFDVDWSVKFQTAIPKAKIIFTTLPPKGIEIIPVVYITNKTLLESQPASITELSVRIGNQVQNIATQNQIVFNELQIDCDWNDPTREKYFKLLSLLQNTMNNEGKKISATIRLHQIKYKAITGVPPVNKGMLMYYNMGKLDPNSAQNSIFNSADANKYASYIKSYPLPLDVVLPAFSWGIQSHHGKIKELLSNYSLSFFRDSINFTKDSMNRYTVKKPFLSHGIYFMKDDKIKIEEITPELCKQAALEVSGEFRKTPHTIAIYHLDSLTLNSYETKDFEEVYSYFH
jgi:hypothetical protein